MNINKVYECPRCGHNDRLKANMKKHLNRKKICKSILTDLSQQKCLEILNGNEYISITSLKEMLKNKQQEIDLLKNNDNKNDLLKIIKQQKELIVGQEKIIKEKKEEIMKLNQSLGQNNEKEYNQECIYLILEREFINNTVKVGKLGMSKTFRNRMGDYPKGSKIIHVKRCKNSSKSEEELLVLFGILFKQRTDVGKEYFEGDLDEMSKQIDSYFYNQDKKLVNKDKLVLKGNC